MEEKDDLRQRLIQRIKAKRVNIDTFGGDLQRDGNRLSNLSIFCTAAAAIFTAGPALGGREIRHQCPANAWLGKPDQYLAVAVFTGGHLVRGCNHCE